ncbi:MAG: hypothetical protein NC086_02610 [Alistipes sp.]|nr:hypothetical protein [Alistipes sp.]
MHKNLLILPLLFLTLHFTACGSPASAPADNTFTSSAETQKPVETSSPETAQTEPASSALDEAVLIDIMQKACGCNLETYLCLDMDHDGRKELLGAFVANTDGYYHIWYCNSDGTVCEEVLCSGSYYDACNIEVIAHNHETHVVINTYNVMGTIKCYSILALQNSQIQCLVENQPGYVGTDDEGNIYLSVEAYDGMYDPDIQTTIMHTWNRTYLTYDNTDNTYKEYTAKEVSEEEFLKLANAKELLEQIRAEETNENTAKIEFSFFIRKNGILHIQYNVFDTAGYIYYNYYTLRYQEDTILDGLGEPNAGQMYESFSGLEAVE